MQETHVSTSAFKLEIADINETVISGSPTCKVQIGNLTVSMLVDTGADLSLIDKSVVKKIPNKYVVMNSYDNSSKVKWGGGQQLKITGKIVLRCKLGNKLYPVTFSVADKLGRSGIVGSDFLEGMGANIDYENQVLTLTDHNAILLTPKGAVNNYALVRLARRTTVPAKSSIVALVEIRGRKGKGNLLINPIPSCPAFVNDPGVSVAPTLVDSRKSQKLPICIVNDTSYTKVFPSKSVIAVAETPNKIVSEAAIHTNMTSNSNIFDGLEMPDVSEERKQMLHNVLLQHRHLFAQSDNDLGKTDVVQMTIDTGNGQPIRQKPYRSALTQKETIEKHINAMLDADIIRESTSPWASPVVIVPKKDGSLRFCIDYRKLNNTTVKNCYPLPNIDDIFSSLGQARYFSCLDLKSGYWQIAMHEADKPKTAFVSHQGLYEFNVMPFGLTNAPSVFQDLMNHVLRGIRNKYAMAYIDDILVYSRTYEDHIKHLTEVFRRLEKAKLKLKLSKCEFFKSRVNYLGHVISDKGIEPNPEKVVKVRAMKPPTAVREVRGFLGAVGYYMKFIECFAKIAKPLVQLTKKNARFVWGPNCQLAFETLKEKLASAPILAYPDPNLPYKLYTDASEYAVGAVLTQDFGQGEQVIQYVSHKLNAGQQKWPTIEREGFAIVYAVNRLRHYLYGADFIIYTDHKPLKTLFTSEMKNTRVQKWAIKIEEYNPRIEYKPGKLNMVADLMSRLHDTTNDDTQTRDVIHQDDDNSLEIDLINSDQLQDTLPNHVEQEEKIEEADMEINELVIASMDLLKLQKEDEFCCQIVKTLHDENSDYNMQNYVLLDEILYHISAPVRLDPEPHLQLVIPDVLQNTVLHALHDDSGHLGIDKTYDKIRTRYYWANMYHDVVHHIDKCDACRSKKLTKQRAPLGDMPVAKYPFEILGIDTCGPYMQSDNGAKYVIVIIDHFSGWPEAYATTDKSAQTVASILLEDFIPRHSCPRLIISDQGTEFCNAVIDSLSTELNIQRIRTSPYHPQSNGKTERFNRVLNDIISKYVSPGQQDWDAYIQTALMAYRMSPNSTTRFTPFFLVYGRDPVLPMDTLLAPKLKYRGEEYVPVMLERLHKAFTSVKHFTYEAMEKNKEYVERTATTRVFKPGDAVHYLDKRSHPHMSKKLLKSWLPYYRVVEKMSPLNYRIKSQLTGNSKVVHIENLLAAHVDNTWDKDYENFLPVMHKYRQKLRDLGKLKKSGTPVRQQPPRAAKLALSDALTPLPTQYVEQTARTFKNRQSELGNLAEGIDIDDKENPLEQGTNVQTLQPCEPVIHTDSESPVQEPQSHVLAKSQSSIPTHRYNLRGTKRNIEVEPVSPQTELKRTRMDENYCSDDDDSMDVTTVSLTDSVASFYNWVTNIFTDVKPNKGIIHNV